MLTILDKIIIDNYKNIRYMEMPLDEITIIIGPTGSGKSSIIEAINNKVENDGIDHIILRPLERDNLIEYVAQNLSVPKYFDSIVENIKKILPYIQDIFWEKDNLFFQTNSSILSVAAMSCGTLNLVYIVSTFNYLNAPWPIILLIDDIDLGMAPTTVVNLAQFIHNFNTNAQVVITTNSPDFLEYCDPKNIRLLYFSENGDSQYISMTDHHLYPEYKDIMSPGELWSIMEIISHQSES
jgi:predicted ATP-binding protein involved in virulence